jgi:acyl-CoA thioesterase-1
MHVRVIFALSFVILMETLAPASRADDAARSPAPIAERLPELRLLHGPWDGGTIHRESVLFIKGAGGKASAKLLFDAERVLAVKAADGLRTFAEGRDYELAPDGSGLVLTPDSRVASLDEAALFPPKGSRNSIGHRAGHPETNVLFDNAHYFHDRQVEVSYVPRGAKWDAYRPTFAGERLGRTVEKLKKKQPVTIAVSGDSISEGYNASLFTKTPPFLPSFPGLVAAQLEATYGSRVTHRNFAVGGWSSRQGLNRVAAQ